MTCCVDADSCSSLVLVKRHEKPGKNELPSTLLASPAQRNHVVVHLRKDFDGGGEKRRKVKRKKHDKENERPRELDDSAQVVLSRLEQHVIANKIFRGEYYAVLLTHPLTGKKTDSTVCYTKNPLYELYIHNNRLVSDRLTSVAAPWWELDCVLGPFTSSQSALVCCQRWVTGSRGKLRKREKAPALREFYNVELYSRSLSAEKSFTQHLRDLDFNEKTIRTYTKMLDKRRQDR